MDPPPNAPAIHPAIAIPAAQDIVPRRCNDGNTAPYNCASRAILEHKNGPAGRYTYCDGRMICSPFPTRRVGQVEARVNSGAPPACDFREER